MVTLGEYAAENVECCVICGGKGEFVFNAPTPHDDIALDVYSCPDCKCTYNSPRMTEDAMASFYQSGEFFNRANNTRNGRGDYGERHRAVRLLFLLLQLTNIKNPTRCLDVGCSQGHFLERLKDWSFGVETVGYDLYVDPEAICEVISDKSDITGEFDFISCIHTLEHVYDPMAELEWMNSLLVDDGLLVLELPVERQIMLEHPITFSADAVPLLMEHIGIKNYTTINAPSLASCLVFAKK